MEQEIENRKNLSDQIEKIEKKLDKISKYILWLKISSIIKFILILIPIILGFIYLPSWFGEIKTIIGKILNILQKINP